MDVPPRGLHVGGGREVGPSLCIAGVGKSRHIFHHSGHSEWCQIHQDFTSGNFGCAEYRAGNTLGDHYFRSSGIEVGFGEGFAVDESEVEYLPEVVVDGSEVGLHVLAFRNGHCRRCGEGAVGGGCLGCLQREQHLFCCIIAHGTVGAVSLAPFLFIRGEIFVVEEAVAVAFRSVGGRKHLLHHHHYHYQENGQRGARYRYYAQHFLVFHLKPCRAEYGVEFHCCEMRLDDT